MPYESDAVTRLIIDSHDAAAFAPVAHLTVGGFRDWLLSDTSGAGSACRARARRHARNGGRVAKICRVQDLIVIAAKCSVVTASATRSVSPGGCRSGSSRITRPTIPAASPRSIFDGLLLGAGDAVIGINPATDSPQSAQTLLTCSRSARKLDIPTQSCVLAHVTTTLDLIGKGAPVDLVFQSIAGTEAANRSFGIDLALLGEARDAALSLHRGTVGDKVMYFETGQGRRCPPTRITASTSRRWRHAPMRWRERSAVSGQHRGRLHRPGISVRRQTDHPRRVGGPFLRQAARRADGLDVCYTNHAEADQDDMDTLLTLLVAAGVNFVMGVPGADDIMLGYQSTSFHDALAMRDLLGRRPAPEFEAWLTAQGLIDEPAASVRSACRTAAPAASCRMTGNPARTPDQAPWLRLRALTAARIGLARSGASLATAPLLDFRLAHARARDAVHAPLDAVRLADDAAALGLPVLTVDSAAADRRVLFDASGSGAATGGGGCRGTWRPVR